MDGQRKVQDSYRHSLSDLKLETKTFTEKNEIKPWLYNKLLKSKGFKIAIERSDNNKIIFKCKHKSMNNPCSFRIRANYSIKFASWSLVIINESHNHDFKNIHSKSTRSKSSNVNCSRRKIVDTIVKQIDSIITLKILNKDSFNDDDKVNLIESLTLKFINNNSKYFSDNFIQQLNPKNHEKVINWCSIPLSPLLNEENNNNSNNSNNNNSEDTSSSSIENLIHLPGLNLNPNLMLHHSTSSNININNLINTDDNNGQNTTNGSNTTSNGNIDDQSKQTNNKLINNLNNSFNLSNNNNNHSISNNTNNISTTNKNNINGLNIIHNNHNINNHSISTNNSSNYHINTIPNTSNSIQNQNNQLPSFNSIQNKLPLSPTSLPTLNNTTTLNPSHLLKSYGSSSLYLNDFKNTYNFPLNNLNVLGGPIKGDLKITSQLDNNW